MPDFSMCATEDCPFSKQCRRHIDSGTQPSDYQSWSYFEKTGSLDDPENCRGYYEK